MQNLKSFSASQLSPKSLSNEALLRITQALALEERRLTTEILWHLHEIQIRRLYAEKGYGSLFEYAVQGLGYSEAAAGRRIAAMKLLVEVPEIEPALKRGEVNLSTLSTIQGFIQRKSKPVSKLEKKELVFALQGKSRRECEKVLVSLDPSAALPRERERVVSPTQTEIRFIADDELMQKLQRIKDLDGHVQSNPSYLELFHRMADLALKKLDPVAGKEKPAKAESSIVSTAQIAPVTKVSSAPPAESEKTIHSRYIPAALRREVWKRDQSRCSYQSSDGKQCNSRFALEIDHIQPLALGGKTVSSNLRLLCRAHNQQQAVLKLGSQQWGFFIHQ
jgi:5-methylcytosine-specific restriction endonuclease McrA